MDLKCFVYPGWEPRIRAGSAKRDWMDGAPDSYPYRCLPLNIANGHGWEILSPCGFEATWNGGLAAQDVTISADEGTKTSEIPEALFGQGTFTLHVMGLLRTPPGWDIYVSGPPNAFKDGVAPLAGIIETDWSPYSFTMNWRLTRPGNTVRFEENEPIAFFFPIQRGAVEQFEPTYVPIDDDPELKSMFEAWSQSRDAFHARMREKLPEKTADQWQKLYYRGVMPDGSCPVSDHQSKLRLKEFARADLTGDARAAMAKPVAKSPPQPAVARPDSGERKSAKYAWLLDILEQQRSLSEPASQIPRCRGLGSGQFLDLFYAPARPVVLTDEIEDWPARARWNPAYLREKVGASVVEYQGGRSQLGNFERAKDALKKEIPFDWFIDLIESSDGNDAYITAYNSGTNAAAFKVLQDDVRPLQKYLQQSASDMGGMLWIGPKGTFTPLHHDLTNNLFVQVVGRKRFIMAAAAEAPRLYNDKHVFSEITDVTKPDVDFAAYPLLKEVRFYDITLNPGDILFIPVGWWHQVEALDFSVSLTYTNFLWRNDFFNSYPFEA